ncbi:hypothetical protein EGI22_07020 [Lacihabitans sp. LS3-19]|nr:hypothetical protein [Lacihabitans sp. LS3-19]
MGGFMPSSRENFTAQTQKNSIPPIFENYLNLDELPEFSASENELPAFQTTSVPQINYEHEGLSKFEKPESEPKRSFITEQKILESSESVSISKQNTQKQTRLKRDPIFNDSLKIGLVFLLIAAGLAFLPALLQLAVLFALVAMIFLFIGLKKLFNRRMKEKKKKQRRENMQMKKDKIKNILN